MRGIGKSIKEERIKFKKGFQKKFLETIKEKSGKTWVALAKGLDLCTQTVKIDWKTEKSTMPKSIAIRLIQEYPFERWSSIEKDWIEKILPKNLGQKKSSGKNKKKIKIPENNEEFAEILGVILGDGHLEKKALIIAGNSYEINHCLYLKKLIKNMFSLDSCIMKIKNKNCVQLRVYSTELIELLIKNGMVIGNKIDNKASLPSWIFENKKFIFGALRGLLDTDGGIYFKQKNYSRAFIEFQTKSPYIRSNLVDLIKKAGFIPSKSSCNVRIQNQEEVKNFLNVVGTSNPKNILRCKCFIKDKFISLKESLNS